MKYSLLCVAGMLALAVIFAPGSAGEGLGLTEGPPLEADETVDAEAEGGEVGSSADSEAVDPREKTIADMGALAIAIAAFAVDENLYPGPTFGWEEASMLRATLEIYITEVPTHDAWGHPLLYWCDLQSYRLVSPGPDGQVAREWQEATEAGDPSVDDIVHGDGYFIHPPRD